MQSFTEGNLLPKEILQPIDFQLTGNYSA